LDVPWVRQASATLYGLGLSRQPSYSSSNQRSPSINESHSQSASASASYNGTNSPLTASEGSQRAETWAASLRSTLFQAVGAIGNTDSQNPHVRPAEEDTYTRPLAIRPRQRAQVQDRPDSAVGNDPRETPDRYIQPNIDSNYNPYRNIGETAATDANTLTRGYGYGSTMMAPASDLSSPPTAADLSGNDSRQSWMRRMISGQTSRGRDNGGADREERAYRQIEKAGGTGGCYMASI
jgi:hypothetical protein